MSAQVIAFPRPFKSRADRLGEHLDALIEARLATPPDTRVVEDSAEARLVDALCRAFETSRHQAAREERLGELAHRLASRTDEMRREQELRGLADDKAKRE